MLAEVAVVTMTVALLGAVASSSADEWKDVELPQGTVRGTKVQLENNRHFYSFKGIPFAQPPVGDLRFRDPVAAEGWTGVRESVKPHGCLQLSLDYFYGNETKIVGQEDCLYLNVYTPEPQALDLPVMVFIHGGGYAFGDAEILGGTPRLLLTRDVVLVSIQYRLGIFGFLSTEDAVMPGNLGLKDQTMALRWVQNNIIRLGGDPGRITIFGESAGASSVHQHILSPLSKDLFHQAIMQSGNALASWSIRDDHKRVAGKIGHKLNCKGVSSEIVEDSLKLLSCLQTLSTDDLIMASAEMVEWYYLPFLMTPRVDGEFLPDHPAALIRDGAYNKVDIISGTNKHEAADTIPALQLLNLTEDLVYNFSKAGPLLFLMELEDNPEYLTRRLLYEYVGSDLNITDENVEAFIRVASDAWMGAPQDATVKQHARDAVDKKLYMYRMEHRGQYSFADFFKSNKSNDWVAHADDLFYLFSGVLDYPPLEQPDDLYFSDIMVTLWTNFAATGRPTPDLSLGFKWNPVSPSCLQYLRLSLAPAMQPDDRSEVRKFFEDLPLKRNKLLDPLRFTKEDADECLSPTHQHQL